MQNCIFNAHCTECICDQSCPIYVETSYLLERNGLSLNSPVFRSSESDISFACDVLNEFSGKFGVVKVDDTVKYAELITYCAICRNWKGNQLHCAVYNLKYSKYLDDEKKSWNYSNSSISDDLDYIKIWANAAKVLVISNFDYVSFGDFESQKILNLVQTRNQNGLTTIMVSPTSGIVTKSASINSFPAILKQRMNSATYNRGGAVK
jgi:hypothetical protein